MLSRRSVSETLTFVQGSFLPQLPIEAGHLTHKHHTLILHLDILRFENWIPSWSGHLCGRPEHERLPLLKAFYAKACLNLATTRQLLDRLQVDVALRRICGWEQRQSVPSESTFSRAFATFSEQDLFDKIHAETARMACEDTVIQHLSLDSTAINAREKAVTTKKVKPAQPKKRGRPRKDEKREPKAPTVLEKQLNDPDISRMCKELSTLCTAGTKKNSKGYKSTWVGYKLHLDVTDMGFPVSALVTSASVHDSQVAIPLKAMSAERCTSCYDLMDAAYDAQPIRTFCEGLGHIPLIDKNPRTSDKKQAEKQERRAQKAAGITYAHDRRYNERSTVERCNTRLKDDFNARCVRVKGYKKVKAHVMLGVLALAADVFLRAYG